MVDDDVVHDGLDEQRRRQTQHVDHDGGQHRFAVVFLVRQDVVDEVADGGFGVLLLLELDRGFQRYHHAAIGPPIDHAGDIGRRPGRQELVALDLADAARRVGDLDLLVGDLEQDDPVIALPAQDGRQPHGLQAGVGNRIALGAEPQRLGAPDDRVGSGFRRVEAGDLLHLPERELAAVKAHHHGEAGRRRVGLGVLADDG